MTPSGHISASVIIAPLGTGPVGAFLMGATQHAALDYSCPEFRFDWTTARGRSKNRAYLAAELLLSLVSLWIAYHAGWHALWAVAGYAATELPDAVRSVLDPGVWMRGNHWIPWHRPIRGRHPPDWSAGTTLTVAAAFVAVAFVLQ